MAEKHTDAAPKGTLSIKAVLKLWPEGADHYRITNHHWPEQRVFVSDRACTREEAEEIMLAVRAKNPGVDFVGAWTGDVLV